MLVVLQKMIRDAGWNVETYNSAHDLLARHDPTRRGCLILDLQMPGMDGLDLQRALRERGGMQPFIVVTGAADTSKAVAAMHLGAFDFLQKPVEWQQLFDRIRKALDQDAAWHRRLDDRTEVQSRLDRLTPREREIADFVARGMLTKEIARKLDISPKTVEVHRAHAVEKLGVQSVAQLVRLVIEHLPARDEPDDGKSMSR